MNLFDKLRSGLRKPRSVWVRGEDVAVLHMKKCGYKILARNLRLKMGEIDILCFDSKTQSVVIVEVKARIRKSSATPSPESNITKAKQIKLRTFAKAIAKRDDCRSKRMRIDVIAVEFSSDQVAPIAIRHYESAVGAG